ncbi:hypothetical protein EHQ68_00955 [Leptospira congkakensis]|uniref:Uncharacterized protein n=1 Tax=Leptospira congkakensis TaxID=2484932 RepID=A0A4Z1A4S3_9LEPT|nr:hypothetical protein [Leptospira congkakensis]TGL92413.1 hypothetical protein EHQ68_00955 [Leptospira congkakensis]TGL93172.1 hypothetical protein EHQ70_18145 [Leptospira congkakensis]TGL96192.1 hypothetical protein EHQ69_01700 [Leptospira congkakensis]
MRTRAFLLLFFFLILVTFLSNCKKSATRQLDDLLESGSSFQSATFCEKNKTQLLERKEDCESAARLAKEEIDTILNRRLDLGIAPVIVEKSKGKEIEEFLQVHTRMGIRYWEIWKTNVILE